MKKTSCTFWNMKMVSWLTHWSNFIVIVMQRYHCTQWQIQPTRCLLVLWSVRFYLLHSKCWLTSHMTSIMSVCIQFCILKEIYTHILTEKLCCSYSSSLLVVRLLLKTVNRLAPELSAHYTLQKTQDLNSHPSVCMFLASNLDRIWFAQHHTACQLMSSFGAKV